jgi:hypothetical protein
MRLVFHSACRKGTASQWSSTRQQGRQGGGSVTPSLTRSLTVSALTVSALTVVVLFMMELME